MAPNFFHVRWHGEAFHGLGVQSVEGLILVGALFMLDGGKRREKKKIRKEDRKKFTMGKEGFLEDGPALLAMQQLAAVRCN
jgi:hypothetical protein